MIFKSFLADPRFLKSVLILSVLIDASLKFCVKIAFLTECEILSVLGWVPLHTFLLNCNCIREEII